MLLDPIPPLPRLLAERAPLVAVALVLPPSAVAHQNTHIERQNAWNNNIRQPPLLRNSQNFRVGKAQTSTR